MMEVIYTFHQWSISLWYCLWYCQVFILYYCFKFNWNLHLICNLNTNIQHNFGQSKIFFLIILAHNDDNWKKLWCVLCCNHYKKGLSWINEMFRQRSTCNQSATKSNYILDENNNFTHPQWIHLETCGVKSVRILSLKNI